MKAAISQPKARIYGLEYLRAIACIFVVVFHASPISMDLWYARALHVFIFAAAVPIFIIISLFLTELKMDKKDYTFQKSCRLGKIYLIWGWLIPMILAVVAKFISGKTEPLFENDRGIYQLIFNGANYPYKVYGIYFLVFLIILSWIYRVLRPRMNSYSQMIQFTYGFCLINLALPFLPESYHMLRESFIPFLIYLPLAKMLHYDYQKGIDYKQKAFKFATIYIIAVVAEATVIFISNRIEFIVYNYSPYARLSIVFLAMSMVYFSFTIVRELSTRSKFLDLVSRYSLGVYLIHGFIIDYLQELKLNFSLGLLFLTVFSLSLVLSLVIKDLPYVKQTLTL